MFTSLFLCKLINKSSKPLGSTWSCFTKCGANSANLFLTSNNSSNGRGFSRTSLSALIISQSSLAKNGGTTDCILFYNLQFWLY